MSAIHNLYTKHNVCIHIDFLVPYSPFPLCSDAKLVLDIWGHSLLGKKYAHMVKDISSVRESSRCVFTNNDNPFYTVKNILCISIQANTGGATPTTIQVYNNLLQETRTGEYIYIYICGCKRRTGGRDQESPQLDRSACRVVANELGH